MWFSPRPERGLRQLVQVFLLCPRNAATVAVTASVPVHGIGLEEARTLALGRHTNTPTV